MRPFRKRTALVLPAVLLSVNLLEAIATYKARHYVRDVHLRVAVSLVLYGVAFAVAGEVVAPWLSSMLAATRRGSHRHAGAMGVLLFYAALYGALYWAYVRMETRGIASLIPARLR
jgi:hypothetical protein